MINGICHVVGHTLVCFSIPVLLMLLVSISVYNNTQSMVEDSHWVTHTHKAIARAQELLSLVVDMETGQRGYLITGDEVFLEPYNQALQVWDQKLQTLSHQVSDNPPQVERLAVVDSLHKQWLAEAGTNAINQRKLVVEGKAEMASVVELIQQQTGKQIIDQIRLEIARFIEIEQELIDIRVVKSDSSAERTSMVLLIGTLLSAAISMIVALWSSIRVKQRIQLLVEATRKVAAGHLEEGASTLNHKYDLTGHDEVAQLTNSFKDMTNNLVKNVESMRNSNERLEQERKKAEAAAKAKSEFLSTMSHEIRTPMNGVLGMSQIIANETKEPKTREYIKVILDSGQHLMTILNDILDFSKVEENKLELEANPFNISQVISPVYGALEPLVEEKNIQLVNENNIPSSIEFTGDCARIRQILFNLGGNAVKFTKQGQVLIRSHFDKQHNQLIFDVKDTGIGITKDQQVNIFNSFEQADTSTTRKFGGTGLGLAIVKKLVDLMGGKITLTSTEGMGSHFRVELPISWTESSVASPVEASVETATACQAHLRVLLVEDNRVNAIVARNFCEQQGFSVDVAENGRVAVEKVQHNQYDLILMDNHMPEMNGIEATRYIRKELGINTLLFAYTADVFREAHDGFIAAGADQVLTKPLQQESFADALNKFASRLPNADAQPEPSPNVVPLHRQPVEALSLTEEELSESEVVASLIEDNAALLEILDSMISSFDSSVDELISLCLAKDWPSLQRTLHATKGMALSLGLPIMANQALELERQLKQQQPPSIEQLQKLVNRMQINIHQGHRMIEQYAPPPSSSQYAG
ncbi:CHASE3 domain-containing protein [Vibrio paucivorans]